MILMDRYTNIKKSLVLLVAIIGLVTFYSIFIIKVDAMAKQVEAQMVQVSFDIQWECYLNQRASLAMKDNENLMQNSHLE